MDNEKKGKLKKDGGKVDTPTKVNNFIEDPQPNDEVLYRPQSGRKNNVLIYTNLKDITQNVGLKSEYSGTPVNKPLNVQRGGFNRENNIDKTPQNFLNKNVSLKNFVTQVAPSPQGRK